jgi:hypothetical protein
MSPCYVNNFCSVKRISGPVPDEIESLSFRNEVSLGVSSPAHYLNTGSSTICMPVLLQAGLEFIGCRKGAQIA